MNYLRCYIMTWDTEFAPNPHHGILTLATCKPVIRRKAEIGDWISGWTAVRVMDKNNTPHSFRDGQKMLYLGKVSKIMTFAEYWEQYPQKRPVLLNADKVQKRKSCGGRTAENPIYDSGDNIYRPKVNIDGSYIIDTNGEIVYEQLPNGGGHGESEIARDLSGKMVLLCDEFYYFGVNHPLTVPREVFGYKVPRSKKIELNDVQKLIDFIHDNYHCQGIINLDK